MPYIDVTDDWTDYDDDRPGMYGGGDIEPDARDYAGPSSYCPHGTYIGSAYGPDYICGYCESGVSVTEFRKIQAEEEASATRRWETKEEGMSLFIRTLVKVYTADPDKDFSFFSWLGEQAEQGRQHYVRTGK